MAEHVQVFEPKCNGPTYQVCFVRGRGPSVEPGLWGTSREEKKKIARSKSGGKSEKINALQEGEMQKK